MKTCFQAELFALCGMPRSQTSCRFTDKKSNFEQKRLLIAQWFCDQVKNQKERNCPS